MSWLQFITHEGPVCWPWQHLVVIYYFAVQWHSVDVNSCFTLTFTPSSLDLASSFLRVRMSMWNCRAWLKQCWKSLTQIHKPLGFAWPKRTIVAFKKWLILMFYFGIMLFKKMNIYLMSVLLFHFRFKVLGVCVLITKLLVLLVWLKECKPISNPKYL